MVYRILSEEERIILTYFYKSERLNREEKFTVLLTPDNNHFAVIGDLERKGLIFRWEPECQKCAYPIFLIDRQLTQDDFSNELRETFGEQYDGLRPDTAPSVFSVGYFCF